MTGALVGVYERLAGKLLVASYRLRHRRANGFEDAHELRHIAAALAHGDSSECTRACCKLDRMGVWRAVEREYLA